MIALRTGLGLLQLFETIDKNNIQFGMYVAMCLLYSITVCTQMESEFDTIRLWTYSLLGSVIIMPN